MLQPGFQTFTDFGKEKHQLISTQKIVICQFCFLYSPLRIPRSAQVANTKFIAPCQLSHTYFLEDVLAISVSHEQSCAAGVVVSVPAAVAIRVMHILSDRKKIVVFTDTTINCDSSNLFSFSQGDERWLVSATEHECTFRPFLLINYKTSDKNSFTTNVD